MDFSTLPTGSLTRHKIAAPLRLFARSHRPLAFVGGQALLTVAPLIALLGWGDAERWAQQISAPDGADAVDAWLGDSIVNPEFRRLSSE